MVMLVAFATLQRKVDDCPRSIVAGSAAKVSMRGGFGLGGGGGGGSSLGGGGGGAVATFFLHPAAASKSIAANTAALSVLTLIRILYVLILPKGMTTRIYSIPLAHTGWRLFPCIVSWRTFVPFASMV